MKTRTHFSHRIDMLDDDGEILEHLAGVEDYTSPWRPMKPQSSGGRKQPSCYANPQGSFTTAAGRDW
jgi:hypothetical protein